MTVKVTLPAYNWIRLLSAFRVFVPEAKWEILESEAPVHVPCANN